MDRSVMMTLVSLLVLVIAATSNGFSIGSIKLPSFLDNLVEKIKPKQKVCVSGKIACVADPRKEAFVKIKLWDIDRWRPDDVMAEGRTNEDGFFDICGGGRDPFGTIDPILKVYHKCPYMNKDPNDKTVHVVDCYRKIRIPIPESYIGKKYELLEDLILDERQTNEGTHCDF